ncbi:hypothetical protein EP47_00955 [Legionella norrlandica]|uniref:Uncharacterized protein n=1 Tax=Legionella norrlandica TaxID=1498499 RepID=A0A0A2SPC8_9GAMM|nr:hypothetical protein [Legionella norrlandica]KGP62612.1 hypothetical protein EP47_00955 [Legionella norrlandica]
MNKVSIFLGIVFFSLEIFAADIPSVDEGVSQLNMEECIGENYQQCLDDVCITSDEIDCNSNCQSLAEDKCQQQVDG